MPVVLGRQVDRCLGRINVDRKPLPPRLSNGPTSLPVLQEAEVPRQIDRMAELFQGLGDDLDLVQVAGRAERFAISLPGPARPCHLPRPPRRPSVTRATASRRNSRLGSSSMLGIHVGRRSDRCARSTHTPAAGPADRVVLSARNVSSGASGSLPCWRICRSATVSTAARSQLAASGPGAIHGGQHDSGNCSALVRGGELGPGLVGAAIPFAFAVDLRSVSIAAAVISPWAAGTRTKAPRAGSGHASRARRMQDLAVVGDLLEAPSTDAANQSSVPAGAIVIERPGHWETRRESPQIPRSGWPRRLQ